MTRRDHLERLAARYWTQSGRPVLSYVVGEGWILMSDWHCHVNGDTVIVLAGFHFDLASIPRVFWPLIGPMDCSIEAPLVHDALYRDHDLGGREWRRRQVDRLFRLIMREERVKVWRRTLAWLAVRMFGWWAWRKSPRLG